MQQEAAASSGGTSTAHASSGGSGEAGTGLHVCGCQVRSKAASPTSMCQGRVLQSFLAGLRSLEAWRVTTVWQQPLKTVLKLTTGDRWQHELMLPRQSKQDACCDVSLPLLLLLLLDLHRTPEEFAAGRPVGSVNIPFLFKTAEGACASRQSQHLQLC